MLKTIILDLLCSFEWHLQTETKREIIEKSAKFETGNVYERCKHCDILVDSYRFTHVGPFNFQLTK